jgi:hypothetical protein
MTLNCAIDLVGGCKQSVSVGNDITLFASINLDTVCGNSKK